MHKLVMGGELIFRIYRIREGIKNTQQKTFYVAYFQSSIWYDAVFDYSAETSN